MSYNRCMKDYNEIAWEALLAVSMLKKDEELRVMRKEHLPGLISEACSKGTAISFDGKVRTLYELSQSIDGLKGKKFFTAGYRSELVAPVVRILHDCEFKEEAENIIEAAMSDNFVQEVLSVLGELSFKYTGNYKGDMSSGKDRRMLVQDLIPYFIRALKQYSWDFRSIEGELYEKVKKVWEEKLGFVHGMKCDIPYSQFFLCVSMSKSFDFVNTRYEVVSTSIITEEKPYLYGEGDKHLGWVFAPQVSDVVGMSPSDAAAKVNRHDAYFDLDALFGSYPWLDLCHSVYAAHADFLQMYPLDEFMKRTNSFNELVLRGDKEPFAIFVKKEVCNDPKMVDTVNVLASVFSKPIVCYDEDAKTVTKVEQLTVDTVAMQENLTSNTAELLGKLVGSEVLFPKKFSVRDVEPIKQVITNMITVLGELGEEL